MTDEEFRKQQIELLRNIERLLTRIDNNTNRNVPGSATSPSAVSSLYPSSISSLYPSMYPKY